MDEVTSKLRLFSIGVVVDDKVLGTDLINVFPIEAVPYVSGVLDSTFIEVASEGVDHEGNPYISTITKGDSLVARWIGKSNRRTSPNVMAGEQVLIYTVGDTDDYLWEPMGRDDNLRRGEQVIWSFNSSSDHGSNKDLPITSKDNYFFTIDTVTKILSIDTSDDDGEYCRYNLALDTKAGSYIFRDNIGNSIYLDSSKAYVGSKNANNTFIDLNKRNIFGHAYDTINWNTTKTGIHIDNAGIHMSGGGNWRVDVGSGNISTDGTISAKGSISSMGSLTTHNSMANGRNMIQDGRDLDTLKAIHGI